MPQPTRAAARAARRTTKPIQSLQRLLARAGGVGELLLRGGALPEEIREPRLDALLGGGRGSAARVDLVEANVERGEIKLSDAGVKRGDLAAELLGPLGRSRLQRERPEPLAHLGLDVTSALHFDRDAGEF